MDDVLGYLTSQDWGVCSLILTSPRIKGIKEDFPLASQDNCQPLECYVESQSEAAKLYSN